MLGCAIVPRNSGLRRLQYDDCFYLWRTVLIRVALLRSALLPKTIKFRINVTLSSQPRTPASLHARTAATCSYGGGPRDDPSTSFLESLFRNNLHCRAQFHSLFFSRDPLAYKYTAKHFVTLASTSRLHGTVLATGRVCIDTSRKQSIVRPKSKFTDPNVQHDRTRSQS